MHPVLEKIRFRFDWGQALNNHGTLYWLESGTFRSLRQLTFQEVDKVVGVQRIKGNSVIEVTEDKQRDAIRKALTKLNSTKSETYSRDGT